MKLPFFLMFLRIHLALITEIMKKLLQVALPWQRCVARPCMQMLLSLHRFSTNLGALGEGPFVAKLFEFSIMWLN
jgi:hypothetical protein